MEVTVLIYTNISRDYQAKHARSNQVGQPSGENVNDILLYLNDAMLKIKISLLCK